MQHVARHDIESLRRRINSFVGAEPTGSDRPVRTASHVQPRDRPSTPSKIGIDGEVYENTLGRFLLQEHIYANSRMHGSFPVERLQSVSGEWIKGISQGGVGVVDPNRWVFLDTETTGIAGGTGTCAFLVGVGAIEDDGFRVKLYFMRDYDEEAAMLSALAEHLSRYEVLITYNGKAFDCPLLETRYRMKRQRNPLKGMGHVDLLHGARRLWRDRMPNCRLGTLESEILGVKRDGDIPGSQIPQRYFDFLRTRWGAGLQPVFRHNVLDIVSLACLGSVILSIFAEPEKAALRHGQDILGLARWLSSTGDDRLALRLYRKAIQAGLPTSGLFPCLWESAKLERRAGNHLAKVKLLRDLSRASSDYRPVALEALAKHYEHCERDLVHALELTRTAQRHVPSEKLSHREKRLLRKIAAAPSPAKDSSDAGAPA